MTTQTVRTIVIAIFIVGAVGVADARGETSNLTAQDHVEIQQLYARYNHAYDSGNAEAWASTFTGDGVFRNAVGYDALVAYARNAYKTWGAKRHWNANLLITPSQDGAHGTCYLMIVDSKTNAIVSSSGYDDQLVKTAQGWRFKKRTVGASPVVR